MIFETLIYQISDRILTITLNRPESLNAFTPTMAAELVAAFQAASEDDDVGAVIVTGAGRAFCAGMDLSASGNVFGLDETMSPTLATSNSASRIPPSSTGSATPGGASAWRSSTARSR